MKKYDLPCNVIIDLLPLYNEGGCSEESRQIVEEHLQNCENCRELCGNIPIPVKEDPPKPSESETFRKISRKLKKSRYSKLISTVLCVFLAGLTILTGAWYYTTYLPYKRLAENLSPDNSFGHLFSDYSGRQERYWLHIAMPSYLNIHGGYAAVNLRSDFVSDPTYNPPSMFVWVSNKETKYGIHIFEKNTIYQMYVDKDVNYIPDDTLTDEMNEKCRELLEQHREEAEGLMKAAQDKWGEYLP